MKSFLVKPVSALRGEIFLSGDKSIAHRCVIISAIAQGKTTLENFPTNKDCLYTLDVIRKLGIKIKPEQLTLRLRSGLMVSKVEPLKTPKEHSLITVFGKGLYGLKKPKVPIFVGDSGTTLRLLLGLLAGQDFAVRLIAGKSLTHRPMSRVNQPLRMMGAVIKSNIKYQISKKEEYPPLAIRGGDLRPITYQMPVASAQVKSAILLAGLFTKGITRVIEPVSTRDHTERLLRLFKAKIKVKKNRIAVKGNNELASPSNIYIPADISSASFFLVTATILPGSQIRVKNVSLNPSRIGIIKVLKRMGADIKIKNQKSKIKNFELMGDLIVKSSSLKGTRVKREEIPSLIDELPILMVAASVAKGKTVFGGVNELRLKETDRIGSMTENLIKMGASVKVIKVGDSEHIVIRGVRELRGCRVRSFADHRTAMSMVVAALAAKGKTLIDDISCIQKSFPNFILLLESLRH